MNAIDLVGRHAAITGAQGAIGLAIARRFLASGARVTLWDLDAASLARVAGDLGADHAVVDVCDEASVARAVAAARPIDILVNGAGIPGPHTTTRDHTLAEWRAVLDVNLTGAFLCCRAVLDDMVARGWGRIVNVASVAAKEGSPRLSAYSAAKAGLVALTKTLGKELAETGVLVNCITPGATRSRMTAEAPPEQLALMLSKVPMKRLMEPDEVAALVAWLASADCSFTTGAVFDLSGGRSTY